MHGWSTCRDVLCCLLLTTCCRQVFVVDSCWWYASIIKSSTTPALLQTLSRIVAVLEHCSDMVDTYFYTTTMDNIHFNSVPTSTTPSPPTGHHHSSCHQLQRLRSVLLLWPFIGLVYVAISVVSGQCPSNIDNFANCYVIDIFSSSVILLGIFFIQIEGSVWNAHIFDKIIYYKIISLRGQHNTYLLFYILTYLLTSPNRHTYMKHYKTCNYVTDSEIC